MSDHSPLTPENFSPFKHSRPCSTVLSHNERPKSIKKTGQKTTLWPKIITVKIKENSFPDEKVQSMSFAMISPINITSPFAIEGSRNR